MATWPYLDIISVTAGGLLVAAYQVSGEYAMIKAAAEKGWIDGEEGDGRACWLFAARVRTSSSPILPRRWHVFCETSSAEEGRQM